MKRVMRSLAAYAALSENNQLPAKGPPPFQLVVRYPSLLRINSNSLRVNARCTESGASYFTIDDFEE